MVGGRGKVEEGRNGWGVGGEGKVRESGKMENSAATGGEGEGGVVENHRTSRSSIQRARWRPCEICFKILLQFRGRTSATWCLCIVFLHLFPFSFLFFFFLVSFSRTGRKRSFSRSLSLSLRDCTTPVRGGWDRKKRRFLLLDNTRRFILLSTR